MKLSLSSCWNSNRHTDGFEMLKEIADLGFEYAELSHGIRLSLVPGILKAVDEGLIKISSVHNFCPLPPGVMGAAPNLYEPSSKNRQEIDLWFRHSLKTIDFAHRVGADLMVIHSGSIRFMFGNPEPKLELAYQAHEDGGELSEYEAVREKCLKKLRRKQKKFRSNLVTNFKSVLSALQEKKVRMGVENREGICELPLDTEMHGLLEELGEPESIGYWHDAGHAQIKENMGFIPHRQLLKENLERQFGFHLHDVSHSGKDHQEIGSGVIDWSMLRSFMKPNHIFVLEMSPRLSTESIETSRNFIKDLIRDLK